MKCGKPAEKQFRWSGKLMYQCGEHALSIIVLVQYMGWDICMHPYSGKEKCSQEIAKDNTGEKEPGHE